MGQFVVLNETDANAALDYLFAKITKQRFKNAYFDTIKMNQNRFTNEIIYKNVMNSILNCTISFVKNQELISYIQENFKKHYTI